MALGHKVLASFYLQLAQNLEAGMPLATALSETAGLPIAIRQKMADAIEGGSSVEQSLEWASALLPRAERPLLLAAAASGRLPPTLRRLAERHSQLRAIQLKAALACAYPLCLLHFGLFIFPVVRALLSGQAQKLTVSGYIVAVGLSLLPVWGIAIWLVVLARRESPWFGRLMDWVPFFRGYSRSQALADFTFTLGHLLTAGVILGEAWRIAGLASSSPALRAASQKMHKVTTQGEPPGLHLSRYPCFPKDYVGLYRAGELNGQLDHNLHLLAEQSHEHSKLCLQLAAKFYASMVFLLVAGTIGYIAVSTYAGYLQGLSNLSAPN